jgi:ATP-dependent DNA helicase RecQ
VHFDGTVLVQKALSGLKRTGEKIGMNMLIDILRGSQKQEVLENGYDKLKTYGAGADVSFYEWQNLLLQMLNMGIVEMAYDEKFALKVTALGEEILFGKKRQDLVRIQPKTMVEKKKKEPKTAAVSGISKDKTAAKIGEGLTVDEALEQDLRALRKKMAEAEGMPPYVIFSDVTLKDIIKIMPENAEELATVSGMAERRIASYGSQIITLVRKYLRKEKAAKYAGEKTQDVSVKLYNDGMSIEEIAKERSLGVETIYSHFALAFKTGALVDYSPFLTKSDLGKIHKAFIQLEKPVAIKPLFEHFEGEYGYGILRLALAIELNP